MKTLNEYMNDPSVVNEPMPLREVHAIRLMLYDETKNLTPAELQAYHDKKRDEAQRKYGFKVITNAKRA